MPFIPHTEDDVSAMLSAIGKSSIEDLFAEIPAKMLQADISQIPAGINEMELTRMMRERSKQDICGLNFIGAGAYEHHIPMAVWEVASRGEFLTAYTPYQAEASQGTLQVLYEYQTMMASLMSMDVSNASLYDGASALAEAVLMAVRVTKQKKLHRILLPQTLHPHYLQVVKTIASQQGVEFSLVGYDKTTGCIDFAELRKERDVSAIIIPQPNFFGKLEHVDALVNWANDNSAMAIAVVNPLAMALLKPPGQWGDSGVDIACGEGQPLGVPLSHGGPYYGFLCCKKEYVRQLPGRIVGRTVDAEGKTGYVLTLQAREQHIRRGKATSNICTNQGLLVTASTIYMSLLGPRGLRLTAMHSYKNSEMLLNKLLQIPNVQARFTGFNFHEFVVQLPCSVDAVLTEMAKLHIQAGINLENYFPELENCLLVCVTETKSELDLNEYVNKLSWIIQNVSESHLMQKDLTHETRL